MSPSKSFFVFLGSRWLAFAMAAGVAGCQSAHAEPAPTPARAAPSVSPSASADASPAEDAGSGDAGRPAYVPDLNQPPPPDEKSPAPASAEWASAPLAPEVRVTDPSCKARRLREWYRVECSAAHVSFVGGIRDGVDLGSSEASYTAWLTFPARRGDVRVVVFARLSKWSIVPDAVLSEQWLEGDPAPLITVTGIVD